MAGKLYPSIWTSWERDENYIPTILTCRPTVGGARQPFGKFISGMGRKFIKELNLAELKTYMVGELKPGTSYYYSFRR
ncbi:MAG TPA: hypothetical protein ENI06_10440 [Spirochaetales bacterium]|nr:hypothetical protein [Spirochaetales bacterium]